MDAGSGRLPAAEKGGLYSCACVASLGEYSVSDRVVPRSPLLVVEKHVTDTVGGWLDKDRSDKKPRVEFQIGESAMEWRGESGGRVLVEYVGWMEWGVEYQNCHWHGRRILISL